MSFGFIGKSPEQKYNSNKGVFSMEEIQELVDNHDWAGRTGLSIDLHVIGAGAAGAADAQGGGAGGGFAGGTMTFYKQMDIIVGSKGNGNNQPGGASYVFFNDGDEHLRGPGGGDRTASNHFVNSNSSSGVGGNVQLNGGNAGHNNNGSAGATSGNFGAPGGGGGHTRSGGTGNGLAGNGGQGSNHNANSSNAGVNAGYAGQSPGGGGGGGSGYYGAGGSGADGGVIALYTSETQQLSGGDTVNSSGSGASTIWTHTFNTSGQLDWA